MTREILFRGKLVDNGEWVEGDLIQWNVNSKKWILPINQLSITETFEVIPESVGQFTGLTDKKGKNIFEGDILNNGYSNYLVEFNIHKVSTPGHGGCTDYEYFGYESIGYCNNYHDSHIVGNIHDNPELLK